MFRVMPVLALFAYAAPLVANALSGAGRSPVPWYQAPLTATGIAPDPRRTPEAVVQVYAAPAFSWRGVFAVHTWIATKRAGAAAYSRWDVIGWGSGSTVRKNWAAPDGLWYGKRPVLLLDRRGEGVDAMVGRIEAAVAGYPYADRYRTWPGPNSNTFIAHIGRAVPELGLDLPANAVGKDYRDFAGAVGTAPSGTGMQLSLYGLLGVTAGRREGFEVNLLGLSLGIDPVGPALRLPGIGRLPLSR